MPSRRRHHRRFSYDANDKELWRRSTGPTTGARSTTRSHADPRSSHDWSLHRRGGFLGPGRLRGDRFRLSCPGYVEVIPAPAKIDNPIVVRVLENADEHALAQAFAVATEELVCAGTNGARA